MVQDKQLQLTYIPTAEQVADGLTKALQRVKLLWFRKEVGLDICDQRTTQRNNLKQQGELMMLGSSMAGCIDPNISNGIMQRGPSLGAKWRGPSASGVGPSLGAKWRGPSASGVQLELEETAMGSL